MIKPHHPSLLNEVGKRVAPSLTRMLLRGGLMRYVPLMEAYVCFIQGKGAGTGWDLHGEVLAAARHIRRDRAVVLDVGANFGEWSALLLKELESVKCRLFLFEPSEYCVEILRSRLFPQATIVSAAVGDRAGTATLFSSLPGSPIASLHMRRDSYFQQYEFSEQQVQVVAIDDFMDVHELDVIDFMKLDIEGNELAALKGAQRGLNAGRIKALSFEFGSQNINSRTYFHDFWDILRAAGFSLHRICPGGVLLPIEEYYEDLEYFRGATNYLAQLE